MTLVRQLLKTISTNPKKVIVIGDAVTDVWIHGHTDICQDNCVKFIEHSRYSTFGGAANAHNCLKYWPIKSDLFAWYPSDQPVKTRYIDADNNIVFRHDNELETIKTNRDGYEWLRTDAIDAIKNTGAVLLSDYDKGFITPQFIKEVVTLCKQYKVPCIADCKREPEVYTGCILKCNVDYQHKYRDVLGRLIFGSNSDNIQVVITNGSMNPTIFMDGTSSGLGYDLRNVKCRNHVGAGDCFAAHLTLAIAHGFSLRNAAALAHSASRVYVQHLHNTPPTPDDITMDLFSAL